jgi:hypothetical protein
MLLKLRAANYPIPVKDVGTFFRTVEKWLRVPLLSSRCSKTFPKYYDTDHTLSCVVEVNNAWT